MRRDTLEPVFLEFVPVELDEGSLYVSMTYATASHLCACGCGERVVTPLGSADWTLTFDGQVTLSPSVGNGQLACRSHYLVQKDRVVWCRPMSPSNAKATHHRDIEQRVRLYGPQPRITMWSRMVRRLRHLKGH